MVAEADALRDGGDFNAAISSYKSILTRSPKTVLAAERLGWILAAHPDEAIRKPGEAQALARRLCAMAKNKSPAYLDLLAAAQAAAGDFSGAAKSSESAIALLSGEASGRAELDSRRNLYLQGKSFVVEAWRK
jgi:hypothetical protein